MKIPQILDLIIEDKNISWEESTNPSCFDITGGDFEIMFCKLSDGNYIVKHYDKYGFFKPEQQIIEPSVTNLYNKCQEVLELGKSKYNKQYG